MKIITIKKNQDFKRNYKRAKPMVGSVLVAYFLKNNLNINRLGITVSKKIGGSVQRNRAKRRLRESYVINSPKMKVGYDIILVAKTRVNVAKFSNINLCLLNLLKKNNFLIS